ncbi:MAG: protein-disulfide reductase DsbD [Desulfomicrobium sp.]|uniref:protein-disulfide reductase DsbD n=1 Tax=Hoeflea sp. TaxID=1940281 RepID=UPI0025C22CDB|nr:protein-disulfide reductase DsbD [Hoeflea sp.]MBU4528050.1 protein-disulfide reductase DsbD [Alphaproteobacteria bacterium]MBV1713084.1 protein-disulfide reductase DsbD [Desulfomicrobium sp.]MBU4543375.1 protein-disulfide reductase DsbD [Alphaproteobacteria bacterium]MBU4550064.1 protein-disulfide reductase DsbD [Alphaproteobacteria bacterium]MBV1785453.1 protein-disulfide reductase DsbD [Hoeflea sp.]
MRFAQGLAIFLSLLSLGAGEAQAASLPLAAPLQMDEAFRPSISRLAPDRLAVEWKIAPGYYLYRDYLAAKSKNGAPIELETAAGKVKEDPGFGSTEVYYISAQATVVGWAETVELTYQGCQDGGLCYPPVTKLIDTATLEIRDLDRASQIAAPSSSDAASSSAWSTQDPAAQGFALAADSSTTKVDKLLADGGLTLLIAGFLGFGILLAFTPCVFPMYPIVAAMLSREGGRLTPRKGFILSSVYVLSLALAFGLFGLAAAWSGQNLQTALQSPAATAVIAGLFLVLALSNFGLFEIQLPAVIGNRLSSSRRLGGSVGGAAALGFTSAFLIGPCVTAPLAGALLYIARTGDMIIGATALFALGVGKGIPLIVIATVGGKALPSAGAWMAKVRIVFGFAFIATAVWLASPLLPDGLLLLAWAVQAVTFGMYLAGLKVNREFTAPRVLARSAALLFITWGALLLVGVGLGARDPLVPLDPLRARVAVTEAAVVTKSDFRRIASTEDLAAELAAAQSEDKASLVYVTADWCVTCRTIERSVLPASGVSAALEDARLLTIDMTSTDPKLEELLRSLEAVGPPTMIFFDQEKQEIVGTRLVGDITANSLTASALAAGNQQP